jgi:hypothetical protein
MKACRGGVSIQPVFATQSAMAELSSIPEIDYAAHPHYRQFAPTEEIRQETLAKLEPVLAAKRDGMERSADTYRNRPKTASGQLLGEIAKDGVSALKLTAKATASLRDKAAPFAAALRQRIDDKLAAKEKVKFSDTLMHVIMKDGSVHSGMDDLADSVRVVIDDTGIIRASRHYFDGQDVVATVVSLKHNFAGHSMLTPKRRERSKAGGLHIDSNSRPIMNGILYLSDVGPENGPFEYVTGSNHWAYDIEDRAVRKAVDEIGVGGANGELQFLSLPPEYQRKAAFGWDIADDRPESQAMMQRLKTHTSETTDIVWFDADGAHRGGLVDEGYRLSLLIHLVMSARPSR